jgi:hypothetical protein
MRDERDCWSRRVQACCTVWVGLGTSSMRDGVAICTRITPQDCNSRARQAHHLDEHVLERGVGYTPVSHSNARPRRLHLGEDLFGGDAADWDAAAQSVADESIGHSACVWWNSKRHGTWVAREKGKPGARFVSRSLAWASMP